MSIAHTSPHDTETSTVLLGLGTVHIHYTLSEVEFQVVRVINALDLDNDSVTTVVGETPNEARKRVRDETTI